MAYPVLRQTILALLRRRLEVTGIENLPRPPYILAANHNSYLDAFILGLVLTVDQNERAHYLTKHRVYKHYGRFLGKTCLGMIDIPDDNKVTALEISKQKINIGKSIVVFPEGTRNYDKNQLLKGKTGAVRLALATNRPIIPVGVVAPAGRTTTDAINYFFSPKVTLGVKFGPPINFKSANQDPTKEELEEMTRELMKAIGLLCHKTYPY